jgi:hypothetical protein
MKKIILAIFILLTLSVITYADSYTEGKIISFYTGAKILSRLSFDFEQKVTEKDFDNQLAESILFFHAQGFVEGVFSAFSESYFEPPEVVTTGQVHKVAKKYLEEHPELLKADATILLREAFKEAFPPKKDRDKKGSVK